MVDGRVGDVPARRNVEVVDVEPLDQDPEVAGVGLAAPGDPLHLLDRMPGEDGDAVVPGLTVDRRIGVAEPLDRGAREQLVPHLGLLQAEHIGPDLADEPGEAVEPETDRVDVPGGDADGTGLDGRRTERQMAAAGGPCPDSWRHADGAVVGERT